MKNIAPLNIEAFEFKDLPEQIQEKVLCQYVNSYINTKDYDRNNKGNYEKAIDEAQKMRTPWFLTGYIYDYCKEEMIKEIEINKYLFDEEGKMFPINYYYKDNNQITKITLNVLESKEIEIKLN